MRLQDQCCTIEQAKRLKELGVDTDSNLYYSRTKVYQKGKGFIDVGLRLEFHGLNMEFVDTENYHAYTVAELGEMLPVESMPDGKDWQQRPFKEYYSHTGKIEWKFDDPFTKWGRDRKVTDAETEAQARAAMLIYLLENNLNTLTPTNS